MWSIDVRGLVRNKLNISKEYHFDPYYIDSLPYYEYEWIIEDINEMKQLFKKFNFQTDIFVYPYTYYDFPCSDIIIRNNRFKYIFGCKNTMRMSIENVRLQKFDCNY